MVEFKDVFQIQLCEGLHISTDEEDRNFRNFETNLAFHFTSLNNQRGPLYFVAMSTWVERKEKLLPWYKCTIWIE